MREDIARGVAFLNKKVPGWHEEIDLDRLDMNSGSFDKSIAPEHLGGCGCIMAQVHAHIARGIGNYPTGFYLVSIGNEEEVLASEYGFSVPDWGYEDERSDERSKVALYKQLTELWKTVILNLRSAA